MEVPKNHVLRDWYFQSVFLDNLNGASENLELYTLNPVKITLYGVDWCIDCRRARKIFSEAAVDYVDIDIDKDQKAAEFVQKQNHGNRSVPTIVFPDGTILVEPDRDTLLKKINSMK